MKFKLKTSKSCSYHFLTFNLAPTISFVRMCRIIFAESIVYLSFCTGIFYKQTFYSRFGRYYVIFLHYIKRVLNHLFLKHNENKKTSYCYVFFITNYQHYLSVWKQKGLVTKLDTTNVPHDKCFVNFNEHDIGL